MTSSALYVHLPFCTSKCHYCAFAVVTDQHYQEAYVEALLREARQREVTRDIPLTTLYLGGGTPSLLAPHLLEHLLEHLPQAKEVTLEGNPEQITPTYLRFLRELGVTRVSMGIQTLDDRVLQRMNRRHTRRQSLAAMEALATSGLTWNIDLILGLPGSTRLRAQKDLETILSYAPPHLSAYFLSVEPGTVLTRMFPSTSEEEVTATYHTFCSHLRSAGYEHYEISNWATPGHRSVHNSTYWATEPYTGLGLGAGSFEERHLWTNTRNLRLYLGGQYTSETPLPLDAEDLWELLLTTRTRRREGIAWSDLEANTGKATFRHLRRQASLLQTQGYLLEDPTHLRLREEAFPLHELLLRQFLG